MTLPENWDWGVFWRGLLSRKFICWAVATVAMFMGLVDGLVWAAITGAYLGVNVWQDAKNGKS
jgi:hypothetical protein